jgi:hypothetical protein
LMAIFLNAFFLKICIFEMPNFKKGIIQRLVESWEPLTVG